MIWVGRYLHKLPFKTGPELIDSVSGELRYENLEKPRKQGVWAHFGP